MKISKFKKESIYEAYCVDCEISCGQCCCIKMSRVVAENLQNCPRKDEVAKMIYGIQNNNGSDAKGE